MRSLTKILKLLLLLLNAYILVLVQLSFYFRMGGNKFHRSRSYLFKSTWFSCRFCSDVYSSRKWKYTLLQPRITKCYSNIAKLTLNFHPVWTHYLATKTYLVVLNTVIGSEKFIICYIKAYLSCELFFSESKRPVYSTRSKHTIIVSRGSANQRGHTLNIACDVRAHLITIRSATDVELPPCRYLITVLYSIQTSCAGLIFIKETAESEMHPRAKVDVRHLGSRFAT